jgi:hypothetical protein
MWKLRPHELLQFKGKGEPFAHFVDQLIRAEAAKGGLPLSEVATQLRVTIKDGGVDTQVTQAIPRDPTGWFGVPTCWQFKSLGANEINDRKYKKKKNDLQKEVTKPYVKKLIAHGYAYRFCLLGDLTPLKKLPDWEEQLKIEAKRINPHALDPRVVDGSHLLAWAERFPAIVVSLRELTQEVLHWEAWKINCHKVTQVYVPNPLWDHAREQILRHIDFNSSGGVDKLCLLIGGAAGVGKTRLVFETLDESNASSGLVVYAGDEQEAKKVATAVANTPGQTVILVADECSPETRFALDQYLHGHSDRIRVICLSNAGLKQSSDAWLDRESIEETTHQILEQNFSAVPEDRRRHYAEISRGFVRLAADMCQHDFDLASGDLSGLLGTTERYVRHRLGQHLPLVSLLSLFHKVGFKDEVQADLDTLSKIANRSRQDFIDAVRVVRESPGFVVQAGRYWYVTPEIVARVLFDEGWRGWVESNLEAFLNELPDHLRQYLIERAGRFGGEGVRSALASFFRGWFRELTAYDLADSRKASLAAAVTQSSPEEYLPKLRNVIDRAQAGELMNIRGEWNGAEEAWGPRQTLVWLLEKLIAFPEYFDDCEACLFRLAMHETESQIGNNAMAIWRNLFCVVLSGTAAPFQRRFEVLRVRTLSPSLDEARLAFRGLSRVFDGPSGHSIGPPEVAGRLRPRDWQPASSDEERACYRAAVTLCGECIAGNDVDRRPLAFDLLVDHMHFLLIGSFLGEIATVLSSSALLEDEARKLLNAVDKFVALQEEFGDGRANERAIRYIQEVRRWANSFRPSDFDGKLRSVCARDRWDKRFANDPRTQRDEADELAAQIRMDPLRLLAHLDWLAGHEARSAERLGFALGRIDESFACGKMIFEHAIRCRVAPLLRGYIRGLVFAELTPTDEILALMTDVESAYPEMAVDILCYGGDNFDALSRVIRLVESRAVSPSFLATFARGIGPRALSADELGRLLPYFIDSVDATDADTLQAGVRFLYTYLMFEKQRSPVSCLDADDIRSRAWRLVEEALSLVESRLSYEWSQIVEQLTKYDLDRAARLLAQELLSESGTPESQGQQQLSKLASQDPDAVMKGFGHALLDPIQGWRLQVRVLRDLLASIPTQSIMVWVRQHGIEAARAIARHLPRPYLDNEGHPIVPEVLDVILREYDDDQVFMNFSAGGQSGVSWSGDESEQFRRETEEVKRFLKHANRRVREWARHEIENRTRIAEWQEREHAEHALA